MPFSSTPVIVSPGDTIEIRYPTPDTWSTTVSFQVQIGQGFDSVTVGTKTPDAEPTGFSFQDQYASTNALASLPGDYTTTIQKDTTYYSQPIVVSGVELRIPIRISSSASGPKNPSYPNLAGSAAYSINGGPYVTEANSFVSVSGTTTNGSKQFVVSSTVGLSVGMYVITPRITGEIIGISGSTLTIVEPASSGGSTSGSAYFTVTNGDTVRLRVTTEDWYTTNSNVTLILSDNYWGAFQTSDTWSITTRAQEQEISLTPFNDYVDKKEVDFGTYQQTSYTIVGIDDDVILHATSTGDMEVSKDGTNWSQDENNYVLGDTLYTRTLIGADFTTKTTGTLLFEADPGATYNDGVNDYENNPPATYGTSNFEVEQIQGSYTDNQQIWTEVDRYPDPITLSPVFTFSDNIVLENINFGSGYILNQIYTTTNLSNPAATGLTVRAITVGAGGELAEVEIVERGTSGYDDNHLLEINGGTTLAEFRLQQYNQVNVSTTNTVPNAEPNRYYYADVPISGLGVEYPAGTYSDLETPVIYSGSNPTLPITTFGGDVEILVTVSQGAAEIRKNDTGTWVQQIYVQNGDTLNYRLLSPSNYDTTISSQIRFNGPPDGGPSGNPTLGPTTPSYTDLLDTVTLTTRSPRVVPYRFRATPVFNATPGQPATATIPIEGLEASATASIVFSSPFSNAGITNDGFLYQTSVPVDPSTSAIVVRLTAGAEGTLRKVTYRIGTTTDFVEDDFVVFTGKEDYTYTTYSGGTDLVYTVPNWADEVDLYLLGAGGGDGGADLPASSGGIGAPGNAITGTLVTSSSDWPDPNSRRVKITVGTAGSNGDDFSLNAAGGAGGTGWRNGGSGGNGSTADFSGGGGGGGGATAVEIVDTDLVTVVDVVAVAGGGGGGAGAGGDTTPNEPGQDGNQGLGGGGLAVLGNVPSSINGQNAGAQKGGGAGGAGGGWGEGGTINTQKLDDFGGVIGTSDLDANGGEGGSWYYDGPLFSLDTGILNPNEYGSAPNTDGFLVLGYPPQDTVPDPFSFTPLTGIQPSFTVESNIAQITGITGTVIVSVTSNGFSQGIRANASPTLILSESYQNGISVENGDYIQLQMTTGTLYLSTYTAEVIVGDGGVVYWTVQTGQVPDTDPAAIVFPPLVDQEVSTLVESAQVDVGGINVPVQVTASGGAELRIGTEGPPGTWTYGAYITSDPGSPNPAATVVGGQRLQLRILTSASNLSTVISTVVVGTGDATDWSVTTKEPADTDPDPFIFITKTGLDPLTQVFSNYAEIEGISEDVTFTVSPDLTSGIQPLVEVNGVQTGLSTLTVSDFDIVRLYFTTSAVPGETNVFNVTAGDFSTTWTAVNAGNFGTTPDPFTFGTDTTPNPGESVNSTIIVTVSGITDPNGVSIYSTNPNMLLSINGGPFTSYTFLAPFNNAGNGTTIQAQLQSPAFPGFSTTGDVVVGSGVGSFTLFTTAPPQDPILGQWYSSLNVVSDDGLGNVFKFNTKFDGLPVGTMMPVFKENTTPDSSSFGDLSGSPVSRFPGFIYCDGQMVFPEDYPLLYEVIGNTYGADILGRFRLPDMRNKKVVGTGPVDGNKASSPSLTPDFGPSKTSFGASVFNPGSHGGMWFIDTIDSPSNQNIVQVEEPATGLEPTESQFFDIGSIKTTGYTTVSDTVEFITSGSVKAPVSLGKHVQYEIPLHRHDLLVGQGDPPFKSQIFWGNTGGISFNWPVTNRLGEGTPQVETTGVQINIWGFALQDISLTTANTIDSTTPLTASESGGAHVWIQSTATFNPNPFTDGFLGTYIGSSWSSVNYVQNGLEPGTGNYNEINSYIDVDNTPFSGTAQGNNYKWIGAIDIPPRSISIDQFKPLEKLDHRHYITLGTLQEDPTIFSYGNENGHGTAFGTTPSTTSVEVEFTSDQLGLEVLPGVFVLSQTKQLIPTPSLAPQTQVGLLTEYMWTKWLIKAY